jgi:transcriptional regulator
MHPFNLALIKAANKRRLRVVKMRQRGLRYEDIANKLGVTKQRAHAMYVAAQKNGLV